MRGKVDSDKIGRLLRYLKARGQRVEIAVRAVAAQRDRMVIVGGFFISLRVTHRQTLGPRVRGAYGPASKGVLIDHKKTQTGAEMIGPFRHLLWARVVPAGVQLRDPE